MLSVQELQTLNKNDLQDELATARTELGQLRISIKTKHEKDTSKAKRQKKYIARIKTVIREIQLEEAVSKAVSID